jgi:hypothetical protein
VATKNLLTAGISTGRPSLSTATISGSNRIALWKFVGVTSMCICFAPQLFSAWIIFSPGQQRISATEWRLCLSVLVLMVAVGNSIV